VELLRTEVELASRRDSTARELAFTVGGTWREPPSEHTEIVKSRSKWNLGRIGRARGIEKRLRWNFGSYVFTEPELPENKGKLTEVRKNLKRLG